MPKIQHQRIFFILLILIGLVLLRPYLIQDTTNKKEDINITNGAPISSTNTTCVRDADIQFFMYHYIRAHDLHDNTTTTDLSVDPAEFRAHMSYIHDLQKNRKISIMNEKDLLGAIASNCFPSEHNWVFTSDDGWSDTYDNLFPIAHEYGVPFFLGIIANRIDTPGFVTSKQIVEISQDPLFTISSHSMTHNEQDKMDKKTEEYEMCESKKTIEQLIQKPILTYIYPVGHMSINSPIIAQKCGYTIAWSTGFGTKWDPKNPSKYDINRVRVHHNTTTDIFARLSGVDK